MGSCLLSSFLLLGTRCVRYSIAIWWIFFMVLFISAIRICSFLRNSTFLALIIMRGLVF